MISRQIIGRLHRARLLPAQIRQTISPVDLKDWDSGDGSFFVSGSNSVVEFLKGFTEEQIATSTRWSCLYAIHVLKGPFRLGEKAIHRDPYWRRYYEERWKWNEPKLRSICDANPQTIRRDDVIYNP